MLPFSGFGLAQHSHLRADIGTGGGYTGTHAGNTAGVTFTLKTDRTWEITFNVGDVGSGTPLTGTWLDAAGNPSDYAVRYTSLNEINSPVITNGASALTAVTANRSFTITKTSADASTTLKIEIQGIGVGGQTTEQTALSAEGA